MHWNFTEHRRTLLGFLLIAVGALLLAAQAFGNTAQFLWPFFIIVPGAALIAVALTSDGTMRRLAIPGSVIGGIGLILFAQNTFDHYESWAYAWALIPFFVGLGMMFAAEEEEGEHGTEAARHLMTWSLSAFVILAAVFELFVFGGGGVAARIAVPVVLILAGAAVLFGWLGREEAAETGRKDGPG